MNAGKAVYGILSANSGVTDIVGTKIFPEIAEQETAVPFIVYQLQNVSPEDTHDGPSKLDEVQFEFLCYADSYNAAADLGVAVRGALDRVSGTYNGVNVESVQFNDVDVEIEYDPRRYSQVLKFTFRIKRDDIEIALGTPVTGAQLGDLSDVNVSGVTDNQILSYDAATDSWVPADDAGSALIAGAEIDITEVNGYSIISVEPDLAVTSLTTTGQGTIGGNFIIGGELRMTGATPRLIRPYDIGGAAGELIIQSNGNLIVELDENSDEDNKAFIVKNGADVEIFRVDESGVVTVNQAFALPTADGTANQLLKTNGAGTLTFGANLKDLEDVQLNTPSSGALLQYNGAYWAAAALSIPSVPSTYYHNRYATEAGTLRSGATATVELYYTAQADGDGYAESASSDTASAGYDIRRKLYYSEAAQADPDTGTWVQFADIADDTTFASAKATLLAYLKERTGGTVPISLKMTWEEVAEAPAFTGLLNETYGSGAAAAYSVRRLNGNYTGAAIQVERSSDNTTQDIGFDVDGNLDESALTTFCTGTVCKVRKWYDQSVTGGTGSGNDAVQTVHAYQPTIYTGGAIVKENGRVAMNFDGSNDALLTATFSSIAQPVTWYALGAQDSASTGIQGFFRTSTTEHSYSFGEVNNWVKLYAGTGLGSASGFEVSRGPLYLSAALANGASSSIHLNGTQAATGNAGTNPVSGVLQISRTQSTRYWNGTQQELLLFSKSTDRTSIESNIGDYFTQNTPLLDTYTGAAAAYSLRKLRSAYSGSAIRVRRASDNTEQDIGFNVFGELDTVSLASFCSGTNGFVATWYDQSGSANDATQTTAANQPKIYDSVTGVVTENGKPSIQSGTNVFMEPSVANSTSYKVFSVTKTQTQSIFFSSGFVFALASKDGDTSTAVNSLTVSGTRKNGASYTITNRDALHDDFVQQSLLYLNLTTGPTSHRLGFSNTVWEMWNFQELIFYPSSSTHTTSDVETNINTFYSIY